MAGTTVELDTQTNESIDQKLVDDTGFKTALQEAEDALQLGTPDESKKIALSKKLIEDFENADMHSDALKRNPHDKGARVSLRSAVMKFLKGIFKRFKNRHTNESDGIIDIGDMKKAGNEAKAKFAERVFNLHPPDEFLDRTFIKFVRKVMAPDYEMKISSEAEIASGAGPNQFETDLLNLPATLREFFVTKVLKSADVSALLHITDPEVQLDNHLLPEDRNAAENAGQNHTPLSEQARQQAAASAQEQFYRKQERGGRGLTESQIAQLEGYKNALKAHFGIDNGYDITDKKGPNSLDHYIKNQRDYDKVQSYFLLGEERAATAAGMKVDAYKKEINDILIKRGIAGIDSVEGAKEMYQLAEENRNVSYDRTNFDKETATQLNDLNENFLATRLIDPKTGFLHANTSKIMDDIEGVTATFFDKVDTLPNEDFSKLYSEYNQGHAFYFIQNYFYGMPKSDAFEQAFKKITDPQILAKARKDAEEFFKERALQKILKKRTNVELFHNMFRILSKIDIAEWAKHMMNVDLTELSSEVSDEVSPYAMEIWNKLIRRDINKNGGKIRSNIFEIVHLPDTGGKSAENMDKNPMQTEFMKELKYVLKANGIKQPEWRVKGSFTKSKAIAAMLMYTTADLSRSKVNKNFDKTPIHDKIGLHGGPEWDYGGEMGGRDIVKMPFLLMIEYAMDEFDGGRLGMNHLKALNDKRLAHNPEKLLKLGREFEAFRENAVGQDVYERFKATIKDYEQNPDHKNSWYNLRRRFALPDVIGQGGWGLKGIEAAYNDYAKENNKTKWEDENTTWEERYDFFQKVMGARSEFLYAPVRGAQETEAWFNYKTYLQICKTQHQTPISEKEFDKRNRMSVETERLNKGTIHKEISKDDYNEARNYMYKGEAFYHALLNDPEAFLDAMFLQMDQLSEGKIKLKNGEEMDSWEFYLNIKEGSVYYKEKLDDAERKKILDFRTYANRRYLIDESNENRDSLEFIMKFYQKLYTRFGSKEKAQDKLHQYLTVAHNRAIHRMETKQEKGFLQESDFDISNIEFEDEAEMHDDEADFIKELILGKSGSYKGLIPYFKSIVGDENDEWKTWGNRMIEDPETHKQVRDGSFMGKMDGFFYRWANANYGLDSRVTDPIVYFNLKKFFPHANEAGPEMLGRRIGQYKPFSELKYNDFVKFYSALKKATLEQTHGKKIDIFEAFGVKGGVDEILNSLKTLDDYIGNKPGYRAYVEQLAAVALTYVELDSRIERPYAITFSIPKLKMPKFDQGDAKSHKDLPNPKSNKFDVVIPFPIPPFIRPIIKAFIGKNSSLSRGAFSNERRSYEASMDQMRAIIHHWQNIGALGSEQAERLEKQFHLELGPMIMWRFLPDLIYYLMGLIGVVGFQEGFKEFAEETGGGGGGKH